MLNSSDYGFTKKEGSSILDHLIRDGEFRLYGLANAVTRAAQDVERYDRSTVMEGIGYSILGMSRAQWNSLRQPVPAKKKSHKEQQRLLRRRSSRLIRFNALRSRFIQRGRQIHGTKESTLRTPFRSRIAINDLGWL